MADRIRLDPDVEEEINKAVIKMNRSASSIVNELLRKIEIVFPNKKRIELELGDLDINKVDKNAKAN